MLNPPIDTLNQDEVAAVVAILREAGDLGRADRELRQRFGGWDQARRMAALRQGQNAIFADWARNAERKRRERLASEHRGEPHGGAP